MRRCWGCLSAWGNTLAGLSISASWLCVSGCSDDGDYGFGTGTVYTSQPVPASNTAPGAPFPTPANTTPSTELASSDPIAPVEPQSSILIVDLPPDAAPLEGPPAATPTSALDVSLPASAAIADLPVVHSERPAKPIIGGTLLVSGDATFAVAADPDRDQIYVVDLNEFELRSTLELATDDEPGRIAEGMGRVYVALRRGGAIVQLDPVENTLGSRWSTCAAPRGLAFDSARSSVVVACQSGLLQRLDASTGDLTWQVQLPVDLRDIVVTADRYWVSRMKTAQLLEVDPERGLVGAATMATVYPPGSELLNADGSFPTSPGVHEARVLRRTVPLPGGELLLFHQYANVAQLGSADYGTGVTGGGVVHSAVAQFNVATRHFEPRGALPPGQFYDVAIRRDGLQVAAFDLGVSSTRVLHTAWPERATLDAMTSGTWESLTLPGQASALAYDGQGRLLVQLREPATLMVPGGPSLELSDDSRFDTGHVIFHHSTVLGVACASCHPEGGEDGVTWDFIVPGPRQTQPLQGGLLATLPLHWEGERADVTALMLDTYVSRMGGSMPSATQSKAFGMWLDTLQLPTSSPRDADVQQAGRALFERAGCDVCHSGVNYSDNANHDVGTGGVFQTPMLRGLGHSGPYMHDGCAQSLTDRFDEQCGGSKHGKLSDLNDADVAVLSQYLESL